MYFRQRKGIFLEYGPDAGTVIVHPCILSYAYHTPITSINAIAKSCKVSHLFSQLLMGWFSATEKHDSDLTSQGQARSDLMQGNSQQ